jgi:hypothetical protein
VPVDTLGRSCPEAVQAVAQESSLPSLLASRTPPIPVPLTAPGADECASSQLATLLAHWRPAAFTIPTLKMQVVIAYHDDNRPLGWSERSKCLSRTLARSAVHGARRSCTSCLQHERPCCQCKPLTMPHLRITPWRPDSAWWSGGSLWNGTRV